MIRRFKVLLYFVFALLSCVFFRASNYGIVDLDDYIYLTSHSEVFSWLGWESLEYFFTSVEEGIWMPLTWFDYACDYIIFGSWFGGFHIHSVIIHVINGVLVWRLLLLIFEDWGRQNGLAYRYCLLASMIAALCWTVHPLRCESVVFLSSRKDVLSFFWELLALISWVKGTRLELKNEMGVVRCTVFSICCFVLGSMCKPSVMTFPILCLLLDVFVLRQVNILRYVAPVGYMIFLGGFAAWQQAMGGATVDPFNQPLWGRVLGAAAAFGIYLRNFVWPSDLAPQCVKTWPNMPRFLIPGLAISAFWGWSLLKSAFRYWERRADLFRVILKCGAPIRIVNSAPQDYVLVGMSWFVLSLAPMLGIANFGYHAFADRFTYIPAVGLSILIVSGLEKLGKKRFAQCALVVGFAVCVVLSSITWRQIGFWKDDFTLFSHTLKVDGEHNGAAHGILANWYFEFPHDLEKSVNEFDKAISRNINYVMPCYNVYIIALSELGLEDRVAEAMKLYGEEVSRQFGPARTREIWYSDVGLSREEQFTRSMYYSCKLAWYLGAKPDLQSAEDIVAQLNGSALESDPIWLYLLMKYHRFRGEVEESNRLREILLKPGKHGYIQFRYARAKGFEVPYSAKPIAE